MLKAGHFFFFSVGPIFSVAMLTFDQNDSSPDYFLLPLDEHREVSAASTNASDNSSSYDRDTYLADFLGPRHRSNAESIVLIFVYSAIFVTGVVGNLCTCAVIIRNKRMQTVTNYYLFSLAVSDILTLVLGECINVSVICA